MSEFPTQKQEDRALTYEPPHLEPDNCGNYIIQEPTVKNDLAVSSELEKNSKKLEKNFGELDCISRTSALDSINWAYNLSDAYQKINDLPSATPQNQVYPLCEDCRTKMDEVRRAYDNAMKQEPILDKLRAEIDNALSDGMIHKKTVLGIIDKYKADKEKKDE